MVASIASMLRVMLCCSSSLEPSSSIAAARRNLVNGVRRSCETPASMIARSRSARSRLALIRLKLLATAAISAGPVSGSTGGVSPLPTCSAARASSRSGRLRRRWIRNAPASPAAARSNDHPSPTQGSSASSRSPEMTSHCASGSPPRCTHSAGSGLPCQCASSRREASLAPRRCASSRTYRRTAGLSGTVNGGTAAVSGSRRTRCEALISSRKAARSADDRPERDARTAST